MNVDPLPRPKDLTATTPLPGAIDALGWPWGGVPARHSRLMDRARPTAWNGLSACIDSHLEGLENDRDPD